MRNGPQPQIIYDSDTPIAKTLKRIVNRKQMTQFELAVALKASLKKVNKMINNKQVPEYNQMLILIKNFGATASDLFGPELALKLHDNAEKRLASRNQTSVGQTPEKYVSVTLACSKKPVVTNTEPTKPEPVPEPVFEPRKRERRSEVQKKGLISKLTMLFSANNERR